MSLGVQARVHRRALVLLAAGGAAVAVAVVGAARPSSAATACDMATITWDGGAGTTSWHTATNWDLNRIPGAADHVCIPTIAGGGSVAFSTGTTTVLSLDARSPVTVSGGTLTLSSSSQASQFTKKVTLSGGTLGGAGQRTLKAGADWTGGTLKGPGSTTIAANKTVAVSGIPNKVLAGPMTVKGTLRIAGTGQFQFSDNAVVTNDGSITLAGDTAVVGGFGTGPWQVVNRSAGLIVKSSGAVSNLAVAVENDGVVRSDAGRLQLATGSGVAHVSTGAYGGGVGTLALVGGTHVMGNAATVVGAVPVELTGSAVLDGPFSVVSGATLRWLDGDIVGGPTTPSPTTPARVAAGGTLSIESNLPKSLAEGLTINGTFRVDGDLNFSSHALLTINGVLDFAGADDNFVSGFGSSPWQIVNTASGVIVKSAGVLSDVDVAVENDGVVRADAGRLELATGSGAGRLSAGAYGNGAGTLALVGGTHLMDAAATIVGTTPVELTGSAVLNGPFSVVSGATLRWLDGDIIGGPTTPSPTTPARVAAGGTLSIESDLPKTLLEGLTVNGTFRINGDMNFSSHALLTNNGVIDFTGIDDDWVFGFGSSPWQVVNTPSGVIVKSAGVLSDLDVALENDGVVRADAGRLELHNGSGAGRVSAGSYGNGNGTVAFAEGIHLMDAAATIVGTTPVELTGSATLNGPFSVVSGATLRWLDGDIIGGPTTPNPTTPARVAAGATLSIESDLPKTLLEGLTINGTFRINGDMNFSSHALLTNNGVIDFTGIDDDFVFGFGLSPWQMVNTASGVITKSAGVLSQLDIALDNDGVVRADIGRIELQNGTGAGRQSAGRYGGGAGTVAFVEGVHALTSVGLLVGPGTTEFNGSAVLNGAFTMAPGATVRWLDGDLVGGPTTPLPTPPMRVAAGATLSIETDLPKALSEGLTIDGTLRIFGDLSFSNHALLTNNGLIELTGDDDDLVFGFGSSPWKVVNNPLGVVSKSAGLHSDLNIDFTNRGTVVADAGTLVIRRPLDVTSTPSPVVTTLGGGVWRASATLEFTNKSVNVNAASLVLSGPAAKVLRNGTDTALSLTTNLGRIDLDGAALTMGSLTNRGTVALGTGSTLTAAGYIQPRGTTHVSPGASLAVAAGVDLNGGAITGAGTIQGDLRNTGTSPPGGLRPDRTLVVTGAYTQGAAGVFDVTVDGAGTGAAQRRLRSQAACSFAGTMRVAVTADFSGEVGDKFLLATCTSRTGTFSTIEIETGDELLVLEPYYTATGVGVTVVATP